MTYIALVLLSLVICALLYDRYETGKAWARERERLINAIIADTPRELAHLNWDPIPHEAPTMEHDVPEGL